MRRRSRRKVQSDGADSTECGRAFQARAAATGNVLSPSVEQRVAGTISCNVWLIMAASKLYRSI